MKVAHKANAISSMGAYDVQVCHLKAANTNAANSSDEQNRTLRKVCLTLKVRVTTIDAQWEGMGDVGSARYEPALLPPCLTIRVLSYSN